MTTVSVHCGKFTEWRCLAEPLGDEPWQRQGEGCDAMIHRRLKKKKIRREKKNETEDTISCSRERISVTISSLFQCLPCLCRSREIACELRIYAHTDTHTHPVVKGEHIRYIRGPTWQHVNEHIVPFCCHSPCMCTHTYTHAQQQKKKRKLTCRPSLFSAPVGWSMTTKTTAKCIVLFSASPPLPLLTVLFLSSLPSVCFTHTETHTNTHTPCSIEDGEVYSYSVRKYDDIDTFLVCLLCTPAQWVWNEAITTRLKNWFRLNLTNSTCAFCTVAPRFNRQDVIEHVDMNIKRLW